MGTWKLPLRSVSAALVFLLADLTANAQLFYNNGADVAVTGGGVLYIDGATENAFGLLSNAGETTIVGYFRNGSLATGGSAAGVYKVFGDWENNSQFTADQSNVILYGNNQLITGTQVTTFHDLSLLTSGAVKTQTIDANVNNILHLNDCELATTDYKMEVTDPASAAITRHNGFVSSTGPGRLVRATNSLNTYLFPTGWNDHSKIYYRPVEISPTVADPQSFKVRMAFGDATLEGYDVQVTAKDVIGVNTKFFHLIKQVGGTTPSALSIYYDEQKDGIWGSIGRWQTVPEWEDLTQTDLTTAYPLSHRTKMGWTDNGQEPHALINVQNNEQLYNFPNVFNPNSNDPYNASFHIINQLDKVILLNLKIFDRWGEVVFDSDRDGTTCPFDGSNTYCWNGFYRNKLQPMGNYVYMGSVKIKSTGEIRQASGNLALLW